MKKTKGRIIFEVVNYSVLFFIAVVTLFPFVYVALSSVTPMSEAAYISSHILYFPREIDFGAYSMIFETDVILQAYKVSLFVTIVGTLLSVFITILTAYPLSRKMLPGKKALMFFITFTMLFSGGMIPSYLVVKSLKLLDTVWALIIPGLISAFNVIIMKNYFMTIPDSLDESAKIDGANDFTVLFRIIIPLSMPIIATITLFNAVGYWNSFFNAVLYINDHRLYPLQVVLRQVLFNASADQVLNIEVSKSSSMAVRSATIMVTTLPILLVYPFIQKHFTQGILLGSVKE
jgi:putative aldouronate transport system permease protein